MLRLRACAKIIFMAKKKPKIHKWRADELQRLAFIYAIQDREALMAAHENCRGSASWADFLAREDALLAAFKAYYQKRWGVRPLS